MTKKTTVGAVENEDLTAASLAGEHREKSSSRATNSLNAAWRDELPRLEYLNLPLVATGADSPHSPGEHKAPANLRTGRCLKGWQTAKHSVADIQGACKAVISVGTRTGADAHGLLVFDIDGETGLDWLTARGLDPAAVSTWQIHRDTDSKRFKVAFLLTDVQQQELGQIKTSIITKPPVTDDAGNLIAKGEAVELFHGTGQVIVLGQHYKSKGNYFWPVDMGPENLVLIPEKWWQAALTIASTTTTTTKRSSKTTNTNRDWDPLSDCPICGRNTSDYCAQHRDGKTIRCFHGTTFAPPTGLKKGDLHTDRQGTIWAFGKTEPQRNGDVFSTFIQPEPDPDICKQLFCRTSKAITAAAGDYIKPLRKNTGKLADEIELGWEEDTDGPVKRTILKSGDLAELLEKSVGDNLRFNELTLYAEYKNKTITSSELDYFYIQLSELGYTIPKKDAADSLIYQAKKQSFHPVRDYLNHITNNRHIVPADISNLASKYLNSTNPLHDTMLRKTLIGAVARVMEPGCKFDTCLVLVGSTGIGKSTFLKTLASPAWFCDTAQDQDKDLKMVIHSTWFYELAELETITGKKEAGQIKALLSGSTDKFRAPYSSAMEDHDRKSIFVATCNRRDFLRDETGSRRYWVIPIPNVMHEKINISELLENRDAIWKAAAIAYANGEKPFLDIQDELKSEQENKAYEPEDIWLAPLDRWLQHFRTTSEFTTERALVGSQLRQLDHLSIDDQRRAANVLRQLGCVQDVHQTRVQGKRARLWRIASDVSDVVEGSETGQTLCAGTDLGDLSQISDKKAKTNCFLSTGDTPPAAAHPHERDHTEKSAKDPSIRDKTPIYAALQSFMAVSDPQKRLRQGPTSETGTKSINCSDTNAIIRKQEEQAKRVMIPRFFRTEREFDEFWYESLK